LVRGNSQETGGALPIWRASTAPGACLACGAPRLGAALSARARAGRGMSGAASASMRDEMINALELLEQQHQEVDELIEDLEECDEPDEKRELFRELADKIAAHSTIEEQLFYPSVMSVQTRELLVEFTEEHLSVKRLLADMLELDVEDEHFDAKLSVLKEQHRHHSHDEEEDKLFPQIRKVMNGDELAGLGNELMAMFEALLEKEPRHNVPGETAEAAPLGM
jgi:hypothetical protein